MNLSMANCKRRLAALWFIGAGILFFILLGQAIMGRFGGRVGEAWSWLFPTILPTLSLMIGVLVMDALGHGVKTKEIDAFLFRLTFWLSTAYLLAVLLVIALQPFSSLSPFDLMGQSNLWLGPFQGLVAASLGAFFVKAPATQPEEKPDATHPLSPQGVPSQK
jgi:hypothetical protein